jgi:hypothetical protein
LPPIFNFALNTPLGRYKETGLDWNWVNIETIKISQAVIHASKEFGLEENIEKTERISVSRYRNAGQNRDIEIGNRSFENVAQFNYLEARVTYHNFI